MKKHKRTLEDLKNSTLIPAMLVPERIPVSLATVRSWIFQGKLPVVKDWQNGFYSEGGTGED